MKNRPFSGISMSTVSIFLVAVMVSAIGLYTGNDGFLLAGASLFLLSIVTGIKKMENNG